MDEQGLELAVPIGVSGAFLRDRNRFEEIRKLRTELNHLCSNYSRLSGNWICFLTQIG